MARDIALALTLTPAKDVFNSQTIFVHRDFLTHVKANDGDFLRVDLPGGACVVARASGSSEVYSAREEDRAKRIVYFATCTSCVQVLGRAATKQKKENFHRTECLVNFKDVTVLERVPVKSLSVDVFMNSVSGILQYRRNKPLFVDNLKDILLTYGIISGCEVAVTAHPVARALDIDKIVVGAVETCSCLHDSLNPSIIDRSSSHVGQEFFCANVLCDVNSVFSVDVCKDTLGGTARGGSAPTANRVEGAARVSNESNTCCQVAPSTWPAHAVFHHAGVIVRQVLSVGGIELEEREAGVVGGVGEAVEYLQQLLREDYEARLTKEVVRGTGVLLIGCHGSGKTSLVRHVTSITGTAFLSFCCQLSVRGDGGILKYLDTAAGVSLERPCVLLLRRCHHLAAASNRLLYKVVRSIRRCQQSGCLVVGTTDSQHQYLLPPCLLHNLPEVLTVGSSTQEYRREVLTALVTQWGLGCTPLGRTKTEIDEREACSEEEQAISEDNESQAEEQDPLKQQLLNCEAVARVTPGYMGADLKELLDRTKARLREQGRPLPLPRSVFTEVVIAETEHMQPYLVRSNPLLGERPPSTPLAGVDHVTEVLDQILHQMTTVGTTFPDMPLTMPKGVLLYGPPGCGKTQLMCSLAASRGCTFYVVQPKHILSPYVGETEQNLQAVFHAARTTQPAVVFFDEIDGLFGDRSGGDAGTVRQRLLTELLQVMDGASAGEETGRRGRHAMEGVLVCAATNNPDRLDAALLRPGRFDKVMYVPPPTAKERQLILQLKCRGVVLEDPSVLQEIANTTEGLTGADLEAIVRKAIAESLLAGSLTPDGDVLFSSATLRRCAAATPSTLTTEALRRYTNFSKR